MPHVLTCNTCMCSQERILLKYLMDHKVEDAASALQDLKINKKSMCSLLILKTLDKSGITTYTNCQVYTFMHDLI